MLWFQIFFRSKTLGNKLLSAVVAPSLVTAFLSWALATNRSYVREDLEKRKNWSSFAVRLSNLVFQKWKRLAKTEKLSFFSDTHCQGEFFTDFCFFFAGSWLGRFQCRFYGNKGDVTELLQEILRNLLFSLQVLSSFFAMSVSFSIFLNSHVDNKPKTFNSTICEVEVSLNGYLTSLTRVLSYGIDLHLMKRNICHRLFEHICRNSKKVTQ